MIGIHDEDNLLEEVVNDLTRCEYPCSWNLVIPPCFNEGQFVDRLEHLLREHPSKAQVARIDIDHYKDIDTLIRELHRQWSRCEPLRELPTFPPRPGRNQNGIREATAQHTSRVPSIATSRCLAFYSLSPNRRISGLLGFSRHSEPPNAGIKCASSRPPR